MKKRAILIALLAFVSIGLDQATKWWARDTLRGKPAVEVIKNYLAFEYHENPGMAFGLGRSLPGGRYILVGVGIIVLFIVWRIVRQIERRRLLADIAFSLVVGGAIGNIIDRLWLGRVVDFVLMHWHRKHTWPAYNVADAALVVGVGLLLIAIGGQPKQSEAAAGKRSKGKGKQKKKG